MFGVSIRDQRIKWLVVVALAAVLLALIVWPGDAPPAQPGASATAAHPQADVHASVPGSSKVSGKTGTTAARRSRARPIVVADREAELETTLRFNPFAQMSRLEAQSHNGETTLSDPNLEPAEEELAERARAQTVEQRLSEFRSQKVSVLFRTTEGGATAMIGTRLVHEGDIVDGVRVLSISTEGVVLEAAEQ
jgi:hypothetical protein